MGHNGTPLSWYPCSVLVKKYFTSRWWQQVEYLKVAVCGHLEVAITSWHLKYVKCWIWESCFPWSYWCPLFSWQLHLFFFNLLHVILFLVHVGSEMYDASSFVTGSIRCLMANWFSLWGHGIDFLCKFYLQWRHARCHPRDFTQKQSIKTMSKLSRPHFHWVPSKTHRE